MLVEFFFDISVFFDFGIFDDFAAEDDHFGIAQIFEVFKRIAIDHHKVCGFAFFHAARDIVYLRYLGIDHSCGVYCHSVACAEVLMEVHKFAPHIVMCYERASGVCAKPHGDAVVKAGLCALKHTFKYHFAVDAVKFRSAGFFGREETKRNDGGYGEDMRGAVLFEKLDFVIGYSSAVFDCINAAF